jgi:hypothetical protein
VRGKVEEFNPTPASQVLAINDDESKAQPLTRFSGALVLSTLATRMRTQPINASLDNLNLPGFAIQSISPLDPSGWVRVSLVRTATAPAPATSAPVPAMATPAPGTAAPTQPTDVPAQTMVVPAQSPVAASPVAYTQ